MDLSDLNLEKFRETTGELLESEQVKSMAQWRHHRDVTCLDHSLFVSYLSFLAARRLGLDFQAAARGGLLHDLYLYDPRTKSSPRQCIEHPVIAAQNAGDLTELSEKEQNIILSHMWPMGGPLPRSKEAWLVDLVDSLCTILEVSHTYRPIELREHLGMLERKEVRLGA